MPRTRSFTVINNRIHFKCDKCGYKRYMAIRPDQRRRSIRCQKCGEMCSCLFNRRYKPREYQAGRVILVTNDGKEFDVDLHDISRAGIGFDLPISNTRAVSVKQEVQFKCSWNPQLIGSGRFIIRNISGRRVGAERIRKNII